MQLWALAIAKEALSTITMSSGVNDTFCMYLLAKRDGVDFNLASIGEDFTLPYRGPLDPNYMQPLFAMGATAIRGKRHYRATPTRDDHDRIALTSTLSFHSTTRRQRCLIFLG